jgi:hypothetical protein
VFLFLFLWGKSIIFPKLNAIVYDWVEALNDWGKSPGCHRGGRIFINYLCNKFLHEVSSLKMEKYLEIKLR